MPELGNLDLYTELQEHSSRLRLVCHWRAKIDSVDHNKIHIINCISHFVNGQHLSKECCPQGSRPSFSCTYAVPVPTNAEEAISMKASLRVTGLTLAIVWIFSSFSLVYIVPWAKPANSDAAIPESTQTQPSKSMLSDEGSTTSSPFVLFHFGPRKTATSTIQVALNEPQILDSLTQQDNFVYLGPSSKTGHYGGVQQYLYRCIALQGREPKSHRLCASPDAPFPRAWKWFVDTVQEHLRNGRNILYSDEGIPQFIHLNPIVMEMIDTTFSLPNVTIQRQVTMTYRNYASWYLSEYNQQQKNRDWRKYQQLGFVDWHRSTTDERKQLALIPLSKEDHIELFSQRFQSPVQVFNLDEHLAAKREIVAEWFCDVLSRRAPHTCQVLRDISASRQTAYNPSAGHLEGTRIAQRLLGLPNLPAKTQNRTAPVSNFVPTRRFETTRDKINEWLQMNATNDYAIPQTCLTLDEEEELKKQTLKAKDDIVPVFDPENVYTMRVFESLKPKLCQVDIDGLVENHVAFQEFLHREGIRLERKPL